MNYVIELMNKKFIKDLRTFLCMNGFNEIEQNGSLIFRNFTATITCYQTGKVLIQGKDAELWYNKLLSEFQNLKTKENKIIIGSESNILPVPRIGSDESGKGDFFGPLVTVAFLLKDKKQIDWLVKLGVKDSKKLSDNRIINIAGELKKYGTYDVVLIGPKAYNNLYRKMLNVNKILAWSHAKAIENLLRKNECNFAIADQFGDERLIINALQENGKRIELMQKHKGEEDIAVAAASVLAREQFLDWIRKTEIKYNIKLPKGAGSNTLDAAKNIIKNLGTQVLEDLAKVHFKTYQQALEPNV